MPSEEQRLTALEQSVIDLNHHMTILLGITSDQGRDIRAIKEQVERVGIRLDGMDQHLETLSRQVQEQFTAMNQRFDITVTALNLRFDAIMALLTGRPPMPPE